MSDLFKGRHKSETGPVECLGQSFPSDSARREHFLDLLRAKLNDPDFRKTGGFPVGRDEAILAMSDPPYYTACPNPFMADFVRQCGKPYDSTAQYSREPMTVDVSVGKTDPIYTAHSYHTKVPHLAIVPSVLHYTDPGDIVLDGFGGSGMTGVAAQWCGSAPSIYQRGLEAEWEKQGKPAPKWGARRVLLNDLSPAASFIAANNNLPFDLELFTQEAKRLLDEARMELGWMYKTKHTDGTFAHISYMVWSEVFVCSSCAGDTVFYDAAYDPVANNIRKDVTCAHCGAMATKEHMDLQFETFSDVPHKRIDKRPKRIPVLIKYAIGRSTFKKSPDEHDLAVLKKIDQLGLPRHLPTDELPDCQMTRVGRMRTTNTRCVHHMYLPRAAHLLSHLWGKVNEIEDGRLRNILKYWLDSQFTNMSILNRYRPEVSFPYNPLSGVFYVPSLISEADPFTAYTNKAKRLALAFSRKHAQQGASWLSCGDAASLPLEESTIDYIFTDPPFGENIYYADLNLLVESWHRVLTDVQTEAIVDRVRRKGVPEYQHLMQRCFSEYFRVLKPGRWMTVVFSNSRAAVWNAIQVALQQVGFVVAEVTALDKIQGSFQQVTSTNVVKQDLIISAYKPNGGLEERFNRSGPTAESVWDFVQTHLKHLPVVKTTGGDFPELLHIVERDPRRIYDRMASWFIRHGAMVPISTPEFLVELPQRFAPRDGMMFLSDQVVEYDKKRQQIPQVREMELFVSDERSAIDWLANFLRKKPSTYSEVHPEYIPIVGAAKKKGEVIPELSQLLEDNFLQYDGKGIVPSQIHSLLSTNFKDLRSLANDDPKLMSKAKDRWYVPDPTKSQDLEKKREKALLKEFEFYKSFTGRKLKEFRLEVMRAGFKHAWGNRDYKTIIAIAEKLPEEALQEDEKLLLWYDQALTRSEAGA